MHGLLPFELLKRVEGRLRHAWRPAIRPLARLRARRAGCPGGSPRGKGVYNHARMPGFDEVIQQSRWEEERIAAEFHRHMREAYATLARVAREWRVSSVV